MASVVTVARQPETSQTEETTYELLNQLVSRNKDFILQQSGYANHVDRRKRTVKVCQPSPVAVAVSDCSFLKLFLATQMILQKRSRPHSVSDDPNSRQRLCH